MRHRALPLAAILTVLLVPVAARAQEPNPNAPVDPPRRWEVELTFQEMLDGSIVLQNEENERVFGDSFSLGVVHFFTPHLRAFVAVGDPRLNWESNADVITYRATETMYDLYKARGAVFTGSVAWQFRENAMVHPYLSAGVNIGAYQHDQRLETVTVTTYQSQMLMQEHRVEVRPVFGLGAKTYFGNGRAYLRPEVAVAIGSTGVPRKLLRLGMGFDF